MSNDSIRTEVILETKTLRLLFSYIIWLPLMLTIVGLLVAVPLMNVYKTIKGIRLLAQQKAIAQVRFHDFIGATPDYIDVDSAADTTRNAGITATGIAYRDGRLFILENGVAAEIPWSRIRRWSWKIEGYSQTEIHGLSLDPGFNHSVKNSNAEARYQAHKASGFTIEVSDVSHPRWQFQSTDEPTLQKWFEILNQMKEGRLKAI